MLNTTVSLKAPQSLFSNYAPVRFIRFFKYELIKVLVFLIIFFASVYYVNSQSKEYYNANTTIVRQTGL